MARPLATAFLSAPTLAFTFGAPPPKGQLITSTYCMTVASYLYADAVIKGDWRRVAAGHATASSLPASSALPPPGLRAAVGNPILSLVRTYRTAHLPQVDDRAVLIAVARQVYWQLLAKWPNVVVKPMEPFTCPDWGVDQPVESGLQTLPCVRTRGGDCYAATALLAAGVTLPQEAWQCPLACLVDGPASAITALQAGDLPVL